MQTPSAQFPYVFVDGSYVSVDEACLSVHANAVSYGTGTFEGIRAFWNGFDAVNMLAAGEHYQRMHRSARILGIPLTYSVDQLVEASARLLQMNDVSEDAYLRPLLLLASETLQVKVHEDGARLSIAVSPMTLNYINPSGVRCMVSTWRRTPDAALPNRAKVTGGYIGPAMAKSEALRRGYDEAIMLNMDGNVAEGSTSNIFLRVGGRWVTPPPQDDILEGITRAEVTVLINELFDEPVIERSIDRTELYCADEILLCGTAALIVPVIAIDDRPIASGAPGTRTMKLQQKLLTIARGESLQHSEWITRVPLSAAAH